MDEQVRQKLKDNLATICINNDFDEGDCIKMQMGIVAYLVAKGEEPPAYLTIATMSGRPLVEGLPRRNDEDEEY